MDRDPTTISSVAQAGGVNITGGNIDHSTLVGRDLIQNIQNIQERALSAAEQARQDRSIEMEELAKGVGSVADDLQRRAQDTSSAATGSPYMGLLAYHLGDAARFFGRETAIREFMEQLSNGPLTVLHSESGAGKTSLLNAGIAPRLLATDGLPLFIRPHQENPARAIQRAFDIHPDVAPLLSVTPLHEFLRQVCAVLGPRRKLYIFLDQFEEFLTAPEEVCAEFVSDLAECLDDASLGVCWVLALRTEYFGGLSSFRPRIRNPFANEYRLKRLKRTEAQAVITEPAARRGVTFEAGVVDALLDDLIDPGKNVVDPPQLQLVCSALYRDLAGAATITRALYESEGRAGGILRGYLERVLSQDLPPERRNPARRLLESLITPESQRAIRTRAEIVAELSTRGVTTDDLDAILDQLLESRLLRAEQTDAGLAFELAHDYLISEIKLDPEVQARQAAQELLEQEVRASRRYKTLLSADRLKVVEPYRNELRITAEAQALLTASESAAQRQADEREAQRQRENETLRKLAETAQARVRAEKAARLRLLLGIYGMVLLLWGAAVALGLPFFASFVARGETIPITQGALTPGDDRQQDSSARKANWSVPISSFAIEKYEVTNWQYQMCVKVHACSPPANPDQFNDPGKAEYPVADITLYQANDYCSWVGRRLPTELEWEWVARGMPAPGAQGWKYPTGDEPPDEQSINIESFQSHPDDGRRSVRDLPLEKSNTVGMAGNVSEWTISYDLAYGDVNYLDTLWPASPPHQDAQVIARGGDWRNGPDLAQSTSRYPASPTTFFDFVGFRCVQGPTPGYAKGVTK
ncbi:MAG: SUMF1/EgtB/PvdO family nonheme iron enzyme [Anaerolineae bacterium]